MSDGTRLTSEDPARARYEELCEVLGGEPIAAQQRAILARLAAWTSASEIGVLITMIDQRVREESRLYRGAVEIVAESLAYAAGRDEDGALAVLLTPETAGYLIGLTRRIPPKMPTEPATHPLDESTE